MKSLKILMGTLFALSSIFASAQKITYADVLKEDRKGIDFEIIGTVSNNYLIYKNYNKRCYISVYDKDMVLKENVRLDFINDKVLDVDFIAYPSRVLVVYQYQKGNIVHCNAAYINAGGQMEGSVQNIDTTRIGFFADFKIYALTKSDDRSKILLSKMQKDGSKLKVLTKVYSPSLQMLDSVRTNLDYDRMRDNYKNFQIANDGSIAFLYENKSLTSNYARSLAIYQKPFGATTFQRSDLDLLENRIDDSFLKLDNINKNFVVAAFAVKEKTNYINQVFTATIPFDTAVDGKLAFHTFNDSMLVNAGNGRTSTRDAFENYFIKDIVLKRDGSFVLLTESQSTQYRNNNDMYNRFNRYNPYLNDPLNSMYYYPQYNPYSYRYNNYGYSNYRTNDSRDYNIYNSDNVVGFSYDKALNLDWTAVVQKSQSDIGTQTYLSYGLANMNNEINLLFVQNSRNKQIISNTGILPSGATNRYSTLKAKEKGYEFMPSYAKQVGPRQIVMPATYKNNIAFVKIDF